MALKLISIDFWNTIFDSSNGIERNNYRREVLLSAAAQHSINISDEEFNTVLKDSWEYFNRIWKEDLRTPNSIELVDFIWQKFNIPNDRNLINKVASEFAECVYMYPPSLMKDLKFAIEQLEKKFILCIVSDTGLSPGSVLRNMLNNESILHYFKAFSFSDETGVAKPHPKAFHTILDKFNCEPEESLHIGDIEYTDIKGAKNIGMKCIRFTGDETSFISLQHKDKSVADFEADSWLQILEIINSLE
jgi:putative hydrolase of the HAD superfamily